MAMGHFGFSLIGAVFLLALFVPNVIWSRTAKPTGYDASGENRVLRTAERAGQALTTTTSLIFADRNLGHWSPWWWWLVAAATAMAAYEVSWARYFRSQQTLNDFYGSLLGVPVPLVVLPVAAFLLLGIYGHLLPLIAAAAVLGIGHIGIHLNIAAPSAVTSRPVEQAAAFGKPRVQCWHAPRPDLDPYQDQISAQARRQVRRTRELRLRPGGSPDRNHFVSIVDDGVFRSRLTSLGRTIPVSVFLRIRLGSVRLQCPGSGPGLVLVF